MLTIEMVWRRFAEIRDLPAVSRAGLLLMVAAGVADVIIHLATGNHAGHDYGFGPEHAVHLLGVVGMVLVLAGVVAYGARRHFSRHPAGGAKHGGSTTHAYR